MQVLRKTINETCKSEYKRGYIDTFLYRLLFYLVYTFVFLQSVYVSYAYKTFVCTVSICQDSFLQNELFHFPFRARSMESKSRTKLAARARPRARVSIIYPISRTYTRVRVSGNIAISSQYKYPAVYKRANVRGGALSAGGRARNIRFNNCGNRVVRFRKIFFRAGGLFEYSSDRGRAGVADLENCGAYRWHPRTIVRH